MNLYLLDNGYMEGRTMKKTGFLLLALLLLALLLLALLLLALTACGGMDGPAAQIEAAMTEKTEAEAPAESKNKEENTLKMTIGDTAVTVAWERNESVAALKELVKDQPLTVRLSMYGGFEQVGPLGTELPRSDAQTVTQAGDIVLYSGNQIVVFYGSNSWAYTRLGHITDKTAEELAALLGHGDVTLILSAE